MAILLAILPFALATAQSQDETQELPVAPIDPQVMEVRFIDDSRLKVKLADERIEIESVHGKLSIPAEDVRVIELAPRWTAEQKQEMEQWIADLRGDDLALRQMAAAQLRAHPARSYTALVQAARVNSPTYTEHAEALLKQLRAEYSPAEFEPRSLDTVQTDDTKIAGRLLKGAIKLQTTQFGVLELKLTDARSLRSLAFAEPTVDEHAAGPKGVLPDPGNLKSYEGQIGRVFLFKVTGGANGSLWGTGTYTTDSNLAAAAVHAGILKMGETGIVQVKIIASPPSFAGSAQNGLTSSGYGVYGGAYEIKRPKSGPRLR